VWFWDKIDIITHKNSPVCDGYWAELNSMLANVNLYDLYRTNYAATTLNQEGKEQKERLATTIIDGEERTYKRGHTIAERSPWLKSIISEEHPMLHQILGDGQSSYMNRQDVRTALNIPNTINSYEQCNDGMYVTY
jgi:hypothetical protein